MNIKKNSIVFKFSLEHKLREKYKHGIWDLRDFWFLIKVSLSP